MQKYWKRRHIQAEKGAGSKVSPAVILSVSEESLTAQNLRFFVALLLRMTQRGGSNLLLSQPHVTRLYYFTGTQCSSLIF